MVCVFKAAFKYSSVMQICSYSSGPTPAKLNGRVARREEFTGQQGSQLRFYG